MTRLAYLGAVLGLLVIGSILASGCSGNKVPPQPPASTLTMPTTRPVTTVPVTTLPVETVTTVTYPTAEVTPVWTPGIIEQAGSSILISGDVRATKSPRGNFIGEILFDAVLAPGAEAVTFEVPNTQIIFTKPGTPQYGVNYVVDSGDVNGNRMLDRGETFHVRIQFIPEASQYAIYAGQKFTMAIKNPPQPQVTVTASAPPVFPDNTFVLAAGSG